MISRRTSTRWSPPNVGERPLTGAQPPALTKDAQARLEVAVTSAQIEVVTGTKDQLLRSVHFVADLGFDVPPDLRAALGNLVGAKLHAGQVAGRGGRRSRLGLSG